METRTLRNHVSVFLYMVKNENTYQVIVISSACFSLMLKGDSSDFTSNLKAFSLLKACTLSSSPNYWPLSVYFVARIQRVRLSTCIDHSLTRVWFAASRVICLYPYIHRNWPLPSDTHAQHQITRYVYGKTILSWKFSEMVSKTHILSKLLYIDVWNNNLSKDSLSESVIWILFVFNKLSHVFVDDVHMFSLKGRNKFYRGETLLTRLTTLYEVWNYIKIFMRWNCLISHKNLSYLSLLNYILYHYVCLCDVSFNEKP